MSKVLDLRLPKAFGPAVSKVLRAREADSGCCGVGALDRLELFWVFGSAAAKVFEGDEIGAEARGDGSSKVPGFWKARRVEGFDLMR